MIEAIAILCTLLVATTTYALIQHRHRVTRARAYEEARAAEAAYQDLFERAPQMMAVADARTSVISRCNQAFGHSLNLTPGVLIGKAFLDLVDPSYADRALAAFGSLQSGEDVHGVDLVLRSASGIAIHVILSATARRDANDAISDVRITCHDISARKRAEDALRDSEARKSAILQSAIDCIITMNHEGRIVEFNPAAERTFGYRREDVIGKTVADTIVPERMREHHWRGLRRFLETGQGPMLNHRLEIQALRADGSEIPVELTLTSTRQPGGAPFFTAYIRDISGRLKTEAAAAHLGAIVESSQDAILSMDVNGLITTWNPAAERIYGYAPQEVIGCPVAAFIPAELRQEQADIFARVKAGEIIEHYQTVRFRKDGSRARVSLTVSPIRDPSNRILGLSTIGRELPPESPGTRPA